MFITKPIDRMEFSKDTLTINENSFHFNISDSFDNELLESLILKGAYASALLYLNKTSMLESINEEKVTQNKFREYLQECKNLLKENVYEMKASNLRPLCSINGLEILESANNIFRGKDRLLVEDFRRNPIAEDTDRLIDEFINLGYTEDIKDRYMDLLTEISRRENENEIDVEEYAAAIKRAQQAYTNLVRSIKEEAEGTQSSDIAPKVDQDLGNKCIETNKTKKLFTKESYNFNVDFNHKFKGFILSENGTYERGDFILINENNKVKAIHKRKLNESTDEYGNIVLNYDKDEDKMIK